MKNEDERIAFSYVYDSNTGEGLRLQFSRAFERENLIAQLDVLQDALADVRAAYDERGTTEQFLAALSRK